ncbi:MAG TPA: leishmanolysin-related zinc metalloendopeptidase [Gemmatimonadales bacterium]|nr:leishmanolysin-related zinc metalloendopeptidase [Gemmatimonadales bacterium]
MRLIHLYSRTTAAIAAVSLSLLSCKETAGPATPASVTVAPAAVNLGAVGSTQQLAATVKDANGGAISGATVSWTTQNPGIATVSSSGLVTATDTGTTQIDATASGTAVKGSATVSVAQVPAHINKISGDLQKDTVGQRLPASITVEVDDSLFHPVGNVSVTFAVIQGGGNVTTATTVTGISGQATTLWTMGTSPGANQLSVTAATGTAAPAVFAATAVVGRPKSVQVQTGDGQTGAAGATLANPVVVLVRDTFNNGVPGVVVQFAVTSGGGHVSQPTATTIGTGLASVTWTLGAPGTNNLIAMVVDSGFTGNPVGFSATATANGSAKSVVVDTGNGQTGLVGYAVNVPPSVIVLDSLGHPVSGAQVTFAVTSGGGSISGAVVSTDNFGVAAVGSWAINLGGNGLSATVTGSGITGNPVNFGATGVSGQFKIDVRFLTTMTSAESAAFLAAKARWESIIYQPLASWQVNHSAGFCGSNSPAIDTTVTSVVIFASIVPIDGPNNILGQAGPCDLRNVGLLPALGLMQFDSADVPAYVSSGRFTDLILHEMGHVLGFGTIWDPFWLNLLVNPSSQGNPDPYFRGAQATAAFYKVGGAIYTGGAVVPVENTGGPGTADGHWRESVFKTELMTGYYNAGVANPLSVVTIASMGDEGYTVNYAAADPYVLSWTLLAAPLSQVEMPNDIARVPIYVTDADGHIVRVIPPR